MTRPRFPLLIRAALPLALFVAWTAQAADPPAPRESPRSQLARLLLKRAKLRQAGGSTAEIRAAIEDVERSISLEKGQAEAFVMLADARYAMALKVASDRARLEELGKTIDACKDAEGMAGISDARVKSRLYLIRSSALVLRANYIRDETFKSQSDDLNAAVKAVEESLKTQSGEATDFSRELTADILRLGRNTNASYIPDLALGNAYEDLAWICRENPIQNYAKAIAAFQRAAGNRLVAPLAVYSAGRCYYKIASDTYLHAKDLENQNEIKVRTVDEAWKEADKEISRSVQLDPNAHEALSKLADVRFHFKDLAKGDECLRRAVELTAKEPAIRSMYLLQWGEYYVARARAAANNPADFAQFRQEAQQRLDEMRAIAAAQSTVDDSFDPAKQAAYLAADLAYLGERPEVLLRAEDFKDRGALGLLDEAIKPLDEGRVGPSSGSSFLLANRALLRRGYGRRFQAEAAKKPPGEEMQKAAATSIQWYQTAAADYQNQALGARSRHDILRARAFAAEAHAEAYIAACKLGVLRAGEETFPEEPSFRAAIEQLRACDEFWNRRQWADMDPAIAGGLYPLISEMIEAKVYAIEQSARPRRVLEQGHVAFAKAWFDAWKAWDKTKPEADRDPALESGLNRLLTKITDLAGAP